MKYLYGFFLILAGLTYSEKGSAVNQVPDFQKIKTETTVRDSEHFYPRLLKRFMANDTTLQQQEYHLLYYGFTLQEDYNPYRTTTYTTHLKELMEHNQLSAANSDSILLYAGKMLEDCPFDLRAISLMVYSYKSKKEESHAALWEYKLRQLLQVIEQSGDGKTQESAYYVINPSHEYELLSSFGLTAVNSNLIDTTYDYIEVDKKPEHPTGYYFNIGRLLDVYHQKFE